MIKALSELFWVPKSVIRSRLTTILLETAENSVFEAGSLTIRLNEKDKFPEDEIKEEFLDDEFPNERTFTKRPTVSPVATKTQGSSMN